MICRDVPAEQHGSFFCSMSLLKRNIIANFAGQGWAALMALAFVPLYIKFLGIEAYGLIGFFAMLQASFQILDLGLSQTMNREMARYSVSPEKTSEMRDFVRTFEFGYWTIGIAIGAVVLAASPFIAQHWIKAGTISVSTVQRTVMIMGFVAALQWPLSFYEGGLLGLQRQVLLNGLKITISTLSGGGAVLILLFISPTITAFFTWQIIVSAVNVTLYTIFFWRSLPRSDRISRFNMKSVRNVWRFAAGMSGISISAIILTQMDKVILSKLLNLEMFGYYSLAGVASSVVPVMLTGPIFNAIFPRFTALVTMQDEPALKLLYHQGSQLMAVIVFPVAAVLSFFSFDILLLWTGNATTAGIASPIVSVLVVGMALNALMTMPYTLQLAHGWTSIGLFITTLLIIILVPVIYFLTVRYGAVGAASAWIILNSIYMLIGLPLTHRRLLKGEAWLWLYKDIAPPLLTVLVVVSAGRWLVTSPVTPATSITGVAAILFCALSAAALAAPQIRLWLRTTLKATTVNF
jgi:O-antigen/teichoic acid export membrane protein